VSGNVFIADSENNRIRMVTKSTGIITTVAGNGVQGYSGDGGLATSAQLSYPYGVAIDASGNIYISDLSNFRIRMVTKSTGIITTVAGSGVYGYSGDGGQATSASLIYIHDVATDAWGNIYFADSIRIRMVTKSTGIVTTVAGAEGQGYSGDGGQATEAILYNPRGVTVDTSGNIFFADSSDYRIRMVTKSTGIITTVAGIAHNYNPYSGDGGLATAAHLNSPIGLAVDVSGNIFIADAGNSRIRMVTKRTGVITTVAGNGVQDYSGDGGLATSASFKFPYGVALDATGNVYIADTSNGRIRMVAMNGTSSTSATPSSSPSFPPTRAPTRYPSQLPSPSPTSAPSSYGKYVHIICI
jgi:sugar lactone lactonase YvrE